ncbi:MAG: heavy-metal-associated domain-containing protein [Candidatus Kapaibacteriota bacterium]|jgi:mercuric ion binding protein
MHVALLLTALLFATNQTMTVKVSGNCNSCKKKIVRAAESVRGVGDASWDKNTKLFTATFDNSVADSTAIVNAILAAGYDVENQKGNDAAYAKLPNCCQYRDRTHEDGK